MLNHAIEEKDRNLLRTLLIRGVNVNHFTSEGTTLLQCAIEMSDIELVKTLIEHGADPIYAIAKACLPSIGV